MIASLKISIGRIIALLLLAASTVCAQVEGPNGHYYQVVLESNLLWEEARDRAAESAFNGVHGYLATITSLEEDQFVENLRQQAAPGGYGSLWVGGSQLATETTATEGWYWENGEGPITTGGGIEGYSNWQAAEPNDYSGPQSEGYLSVGHFNNFGWNDEPNDRHIHGYVIEYPSRGTTTKVKVLATDPIAVEESSLDDSPNPTPGPTPGIWNPINRATFTFSREGDLSLDLPVYYSIHGTAGNGFDYNEIAKTINIPAGRSEVRLDIVPRTDPLAVIENMETVGIRIEPSRILTPSASYRIDADAREAGAVILEGSAPQRPALELAVPRGGTVYDFGEPVTILAILSPMPSGQPIPAVNFYADSQLIGSAQGTDIGAGFFLFKFTWKDAPAGSPTLVARAAFAIDNPPSSLPAQITIQENPDFPEVSIKFVEMAAGEPVPDADFASGHFEVTRTGPTTENLQVFLNIGGTATADVDYERLQNYVVIAANRSSARIAVVAKDDAIDEPDETVTAAIIPIPPNIDPIQNGLYTINLEHKSAEVVIRDNDEPDDFPVVSISAVIGETPEDGDGAFGQFRIARTGSITEPLNVAMQYEGTATPNADYAGLPLNVKIPAGSAEAFLKVDPMDDQIIEGDETVIAILAPIRGALYNIDQEHNDATVIIHDNEAPLETVVRIEAIDAEATEFPPNAEGFNPARFAIRRRGSLTEDLQVFLSTHGTAINGEDYQRIASPVTIPAGQPSVEITIIPQEDLSGMTHKYEIVAEPNLTWAQARAKAAQATYLGVTGHLATITSADEDAQLEQMRVEAGGLHLWVGGFQEPGEQSITEGWKWVNNEGPIPGSNDATLGFANWRPGEPNDYWGPASENHMVIGWGGPGWNDQGGGINAQGYVIEFDIPTPAAGNEELVETVAIRLEEDPRMAPFPTYTVAPLNRTAAAVIFDGAAPAGGAIEVAIPSANAIYSSERPIEFLVAAYHSTIDILSVEFFVDEQKVGESTVVFDRVTSGGVIEHRFRWQEPTPGQHILQAKASVSGSQLASSKIPFVVEGAANQSPIASITKPQDGESYIEGDSIEVRAEASDPDGAISMLEILLDGIVIASKPGSLIEVTINDAAAGKHTLLARATDNFGAKGSSTPTQILVRHRDAIAFVHRNLPESYSPGVSFVVELRVDPPDGTFAYAVEDRPPSGWLVTEISDDGFFDSVNGKVKFGPFTDEESRTLTYRLTPPSDASGRYRFTGNSSLNGALYPIAGDQVIGLVQQHHPADVNQNFTIPLAEVTAYSAAWKSGQSWPTGPVPIPLDYVTRAHHIWQRGEAYVFDPARGPAPVCWIPVNSGPGAFTLRAAAAGGAQRSVSGNFESGAATTVQIAVVPTTGATSWAVEEKPPRGWAVSNISHEGQFDAGTGTIRWGVFGDGAARTLSYTLTAPAEVASIGIFVGQFSCDGQVSEIGSANSLTINGAAPIEITDSARTATGGVTLSISGPAGQTAVIEASSDFIVWDEIKSIFIPNGTVEFTDEAAAANQHRFFRLRVQ